MEKVKIPEDIVDALDKKARLIVDSRPDCPAWVYESLMNMGGYAAGLSMRNLSNLPEDVKYEKPVRDLKAIFRRMTSEEDYLVSLWAKFAKLYPACGAESQTHLKECTGCVDRPLLHLKFDGFLAREVLDK